MRTTQIIEALLFASDAPLSAEDLSKVDETLDEDRVVEAIEQLRAEYEDSGRAFQIYEMGGGFQLLTRPDFAPHLERFETVPQPSRLSVPALEVLAIIAYRQPIGRVEIEEIRGVGSSAVLRTLQDRGLAEVVGRGEGLGRPLLYGTSRLFLEHFGFRSIEDLPRPDELPIVLRERRRDEPAGSVDEAGGSVDETADSADEVGGSVDETADSADETGGGSDRGDGPEDGTAAGSEAESDAGGADVAEGRAPGEGAPAGGDDAPAAGSARAGG